MVGKWDDLGFKCGQLMYSQIHWCFLEVLSQWKRTWGDATEQKREPCLQHSDMMNVLAFITVFKPQYLLLFTHSLSFWKPVCRFLLHRTAPFGNKNMERYTKGLHSAQWLDSFSCILKYSYLTRCSLSSSIQWVQPLHFFSPICSHTNLLPCHITIDCCK